MLVDKVRGHAGQYEGHGSEGTPDGGGCDRFGRFRAGVCASLRDSVVVAQTSVVVKREGTGGLGDVSKRESTSLHGVRQLTRLYEQNVSEPLTGRVDG